MREPPPKWAAVRLSKNPQDAKAHLCGKVSTKEFVSKKERFYETPAFAVCVNRPLAYSKYADGGGFLAPAVFRQPFSVAKTSF